MPSGSYVVATHATWEFTPAEAVKKLQAANPDGRFAPRDFLQHSTVFILACFVGWQVIWSVTPALHTPLMSVTNAVSGIILVGGMLQISGRIDSPVVILSAIAVLIATINIAGGFLVTQRMLKMFQR